MINRVILIGRLTKDPELRKTSSDISVANFDLAVDNAVKEADGTRGTCFITCKTFGVTADNLAKYCRKGNKVAVDGSLNQRSYEAKDGTKRTVIEVIVDSVDFLEPKKETEEQKSEKVKKAKKGAK